ncbi:N-Acyltransferase superfamily domain-containing protein [Histoplasma capsulatum var. duboisii H88]|uniref:N-Acyltransferase superfamily domain-containing protein n=1 Tax=Ajellomyces capsulatus (strain H88) TaxID=544711 RepID=A0A8A1LRP1_AJEC8|nr:N-Acyltransferase superfamily domain-containing protein [Histoplasma capsulatum var. duboisii H88]
MEGFRMSKDEKYPSSADEWSEILTSFRTFQATSHSKYRAIQQPRDEVSQMLSSANSQTGLQTPTHEVRTSFTMAKPSVVQKQPYQEGDSGLGALSPQEPGKLSPATLGIAMVKSAAVDIPSEEAADRTQKRTLKKENTTNSGHCCSQQQSPAIEIQPASDSDPVTEMNSGTITPSKPNQERKILSLSPTDCSGGSDEVLLRQYKINAPKPPTVLDSVAPPLNKQQPCIVIQNPNKIFKGRSSTALECSDASPLNKFRAISSFSDNAAMRRAHTFLGPPKFPPLTKPREEKCPMVLDPPSESFVGAGREKQNCLSDKLERLKRKEKLKIAQQIRGIDLHAMKQPSPLDFARQGEGNDPTSPIAKQISLALTKRDNAVFSHLRNYPSNRNSPTGEAQDNGGSSDMAESRTRFSGRNSESSQQKNGSPLISGGDNFSMPVVDWQHRPWDTHSGQEFTHRLKNWLKTISESDRARVDTDSPEFNDARFHSNGRGMLASRAKSPISFLDLTDQESAAHAHETASGYIYNWNTRLVKERQEAKWKKKKMVMQMRLSQQYLQTLTIRMNPHSPKLNLYLRPIEKKDLQGLLKLFNWYIQNTVRCVDLEPLSFGNLQERIDECEQDKFPALVAVEKKPRLGHALNGEEEEIFGCILASDFTGPATINRYTAELELFVEPKYCRLGVGSCLVDKLLEICDSDYHPNQGYHFDCAAAQTDVYRAGKNRQLARLIFILHHVADNNSDYLWTKEWLERKFGFDEQALLKGTGIKGGKWLNSSYLVRNIRYLPKDDTAVANCNFIES